MITRLELRNFSAFSELGIDFSPKINVIIGENGTGKTQLLKAIYVLSNMGSSTVGYVPSQSVSDHKLTDKLLTTFKPTNNKVSGLFHRGGEDNAVFSARYAQDEEVVASFSSRSYKAKLSQEGRKAYNQGATYIPAKEVLSFLDGISNPGSCQETLANLFDATYIDLCKKLILVPKHNVEEKTTWFREEITNTINGEFIFDATSVLFRPGQYKEYKNINTSKTYFSPSRTDMSVTMIAEGFRKIGALQQLLKSQVIGTGTTGPLLWDEPESNMNPRLMKSLVHIMLELSRKGQQIILATHDYVLLKWFDLLMDKDKDDHVKFHALSRKTDGKLQLESKDNYKLLEENAISSTFNEMYDSEIDRSLGSAKP